MLQATCPSCPTTSLDPTRQHWSSTIHCTPPSVCLKAARSGTSISEVISCSDGQRLSIQIWRKNLYKFEEKKYILKKFESHVGETLSLQPFNTRCHEQTTLTQCKSCRRWILLRLYDKKGPSSCHVQKFMSNVIISYHARGNSMWLPFIAQYIHLQKFHNTLEVRFYIFCTLNGMILYDIVWYCMILYDIVWYRIIRMVSYGIVWYHMIS